MCVPVALPLAALVWMGTCRSALKRLDAATRLAMVSYCPTITSTPERSSAALHAAAMRPHCTSSVVSPTA